MEEKPSLKPSLRFCKEWYLEPGEYHPDIHSHDLEKHIDDCKKAYPELDPSEFTTKGGRKKYKRNKSRKTKSRKSLFTTQYKKN